MNTVIEMLKELKAQFQKFSEVEVQLSSVKTAEGVEITYEGETLEVGTAVSVDGMPAPDGEHTLEDGTVIVVAEGVVTEIKEMEGEGEPVAEFATAQQFAEATEKITGIEARFAEMEKNIEAITKMLGATIETFEKFSEQTPEPAKKPVNTKAADKDAKLAELGNFFNKHKN